MEIVRPVQRWISKQLSSGGEEIQSRVGGSSSHGAMTQGAPVPRGLRELPESYAKIGWVNTAVGAIAQSSASVPIIPTIQANPGDPDREVLSEGPGVDILQRPNPETSQFDLIEATVGWLLLSGNAYWELVRNRFGRVAGIYVLDPRRMRVVPGRGFLFFPPGHATGIAFAREEIVHFSLFNPLDPWYGLSPLEAIRISLETSVAADTYNLKFFINDATPHGVITTEEETLSDPEIQRLRILWDSAHRGVDRAFRPAILWAGLQYQAIGQSHKDISFGELDERTQDKILGVLNVPPSIAGQYRNLNFATATVQDRAYWTNTIQPIHKRIGNTMQVQYWPHFDEAHGVDMDENPMALTTGWDYSDVSALVTVIGEQEEAFNTAIKNGSLTINEARAIRNQDPVEWGDTWWAPLNVIPVTDSGEPASETLRGVVREELQAAMSGVLPAEQKLLPTFNQNARREILWKRFEAALRPSERMVTKVVREFFRREEQRILDRLRAWSRQKEGRNFEGSTEKQSAEGLSMTALFDTEEEAEAFFKAMRPALDEVAGQWGQASLDQLGLDQTFQGTSPQTEEFLNHRLSLMSQEVTETTFKELEPIIRTAAQTGGTVEEVAAEIRKTYDGISRSRSLTIARTETASTANFSIQEGWRQSGVVASKEWISSRDSRVRDTHAEADGQIVPMNEPFQVGGSLLMYPGDPDGAAGEVINCRCTMAPVIDEEALMARGVQGRDALFVTDGGVSHE